jgi:hypothetical protein
MAARQLTSKYDGVCNGCRKPYMAGDVILWDPSVKGAKHRTCPPVDAAPPVAYTVDLCGIPALIRALTAEMEVRRALLHDRCEDLGKCEKCHGTGYMSLRVNQSTTLDYSDHVEVYYRCGSSGEGEWGADTGYFFRRFHINPDIAVHFEGGVVNGANTQCIAAQRTFETDTIAQVLTEQVSHLEARCRRLEVEMVPRRGDTVAVVNPPTRGKNKCAEGTQGVVMWEGTDKIGVKVGEAALMYFEVTRCRAISRTVTPRPTDAYTQR